MLVDDDIQMKLSHLHNDSPVFSMNRSDRLVIVSDLHMGDGRGHDDFRRTSSLFENIFEKFYLDRGFKVILNGDIEELHKFSLRNIFDRWSSIYDLFERFQDGPGIFKLFGNHDYDFFFNRFHERIHEQFESIRLKYMEGELFFLHGHQSSHWLERLHRTNQLLIRSIVNPLKLRNFELTLDNKPVTKKEFRMSRFSLDNRILTFMGHTHRPLFGSHSGVPGLFNSGAAIGKKGITTLEIENGYLSLVHWWDRSGVKRYLTMDWFDPVRVISKDIYRVVLDRASLSSIMREHGMV
jgi:UDP-2,3-diacylglucosamine pyrophosphatase LpxH